MFGEDADELGRELMTMRFDPGSGSRVVATGTFRPDSPLLRAIRRAEFVELLKDTRSLADGARELRSRDERRVDAFVAVALAVGEAAAARR
ncbi:hypothetical protein JD78_01330 [Modestobacter roseus]|uniref:Uncharacterized protein n=1 Tax=Modestobacter roseus TaxID=1181884 RepID=A0A562IPG0_9ACTN|nr:hypothetical protein JD78_01330 [Modestobacter roseus]